MNLLERAIAYVSPARAAQRAQDRVRLGLAHAGAAALALADDSGAGHASALVDSNGARLPVRRNWQPMPRDANADTLRGLPGQRGQSRELARTHPVAVGAMQTLLDRVVGTGLALVAQPNAAVLGWSDAQSVQWRAHVQREFSLWADSTDCDVEQAGNFYDRQALVLRTTRESGDGFTVLPDGEPSATQPYRLRLQLLEGDRVGNPGGAADTAEVAGGVRCDPAGRPLAYHVYARHPGAAVVGSLAQRYAGEWVTRQGASGRMRILHHWFPTRPGQRRGVPWLAPIVALLKDLDTYTDAEIKAAVVSAFFTVFIKTDAGSPAPVFGGDGDVVAGPAGDEVQMGPAAVVGLAKGEDAVFADPKRPNTAFDPFVQAILQQVGMALGIPVELLLKRFNASYSASKAALLDAWMFFRGQRTWLARSFCQPVYATWLAEAVAAGRVQAPGFFSDPLRRWAYCQAAWIGDSMGSLDPKNEVAAYAAAIDARLMTRERAEWELFGSDWNETLSVKASEQRRLDDLGLTPPPRPGAGVAGGARQGNDDGDRDALHRAVQAVAASAQAAAASAQAAASAPAPVVNVAPPQVHVQAGDVAVHMPEGMVQLEAHVEAPRVEVPVHVQPAQVSVPVHAPVRVDVPAPQVSVHSAPQVPTRQRITRDDSGEMTEIITEPLAGPTH